MSTGAPLELIQEALGHTDISTTLIYAHLSTNKQRADIARYLEGRRNESRQGKARPGCREYVHGMAEGVVGVTGATGAT
jgi:hypothetical protein